MAELATVRPQWVVEAIKVKGASRRAAYEKREKEALKLKEQGNAYFREGDYAGAIVCYGTMCQLDFVKPTYYSNLYAACIKVGEYETVLRTSEEALCLDPAHKKLRYRRMQARRALGFHAGALADAKAIVRLADPSDPDLAAIHREIKELELLIENRPPDLRNANITTDEYPTDDEDDFPNENDMEKSKFDPEADWTESEDDPHNGNGVPCRYYNRRGGCLKGDQCFFSHKQDDLSERDLMGKNVCNYWLLGRCRFTSETCNYSHSKAALPADGWWASASGKQFMGYVLKGKSKYVARHIRSTKRAFDNPREIGGNHRRSVADSIKKGKRVGKKKKTPTPDIYSEGEDDNIWMNEGTGFFSPEDEYELMCQGVNPWDEDAADVLAVLNGDYY